MKEPCVRRDGLLVLDKPPGLSSTQALGQAKHRLRACKGGHTGTLDPLATGVLVLCFGEATKVASFLFESDKRYRVTVALGVSTTTYDAEGEVVERRPVAVSDAQIAEALVRFTGTIEQVPPRFSAIKQAGTPFYERARRGDLTMPPTRSVRVDAISVVGRSGDDVVLDVECGKGVYVRSLAHDLGIVLGCGAHVKALQRLAVGRFTIDKAVALADVRPDMALMGSDAALAGLPAVVLPSFLARAAMRGQSVHVGGRAYEGWARLYDDGGAFLGIGWSGLEGEIRPKRLWGSTSYVEPMGAGG
ncbi:MAG TPA: tRNA pseudouridine(55) synthase TruB [Acidiferrobacter sp.]|nr:tRNA pseudouridine(55) synthase TruB [Acidiferrobacter sp.]